MTSPKPNKNVKAKKSSKSDNENIEFACKFRGKYDLSKKRKDYELSLEDAVNLFEVIHVKNASLFKNTHVKMNNKKKMFTFVDQKSFSKVHHHVPYNQVKKFFVFHKDPTMVIMGVHHKIQRLFLVFQFQNTEDMKKFCDEVEDYNKRSVMEENLENNTIDEVSTTSLDVPRLRQKTGNNDTIERISVHSKIYNENLIDKADFSASFYEPDLEATTFAIESEVREEINMDSRDSSRNSQHIQDENIHCDNIGQSKVDDLFITSGNEVFDTSDDWLEEFICLELVNNDSILQSDKTGSVYMYCARRKINYLPSGLVEYSDDEDHGICKDPSNKFSNHSPKMIGSMNEEDTFFNHKPKLIKDNIEGDTFYNHEPKMNGINDDSDNFYHHEPKITKNGTDLVTFRSHEPKMNNGSLQFDNFHNHEPKLI